MAFCRRLVVRVLGLSGALALSGCALSAPSPDGMVEVADIINSVKCGLAQALQSEAGQRRLPGTIATVELNLKVADPRSFGASSPFSTGPLIFAWAGPLLLPNLSAASQESFTVDTTINLTYKLDGPNVSVCNAAGVDTTDKFGFARWLGDIIAGLSKVSLQGPKGSLDKLTYDAAFAVHRCPQPLGRAASEDRDLRTQRAGDQSWRGAHHQWWSDQGCRPDPEPEQGRAGPALRSGIGNRANPW